MRIKIENAVDQMIHALVRELRHRNIDILMVASVDDVNKIDDIIGDGGEVRCEHFVDHAHEYALQYGNFESDAFFKAYYSAVQKAWTEFRLRYSDTR